MPRCRLGSDLRQVILVVGVVGVTSCADGGPLGKTLSSEGEAEDSGGTAPEFVGSDSNCDDDGVAAVLEDSGGWSTIQGAMSAAEGVASISVCTGVHRESLRTPAGILLTLTGSSPTDTTIEAPVGSRVLELPPGASLNLRHLSLISSGGAPTEGDGGLISVQDGVLVLVDVTATGGETNGNGGLISLRSTSPDTDVALEVYSSTLRDGAAGGDGGLIDLRSATESEITLVLSDSDLEAGRASGSGGLLAAGGRGRMALNLDRSTLRDGSAKDDGGGVALLGGPKEASLYIGGCVLGSSTAERDGGLLFVDAADRDDVRTLHLVDNRFEDGMAERNGGGFLLRGFAPVQMEMDSTDFVGNNASNEGGAWHVDAPEIADVEVYSTNLYVARNVAGDPFSAAFHLGYGIGGQMNVAFGEGEEANQPADLRTKSGQYSGLGEGEILAE